MIEEFLANLKEFGGKDNEIMKVAELKKVKQESRTIEEFRRTVRDSGYERRLLVEEFK